MMSDLDNISRVLANNSLQKLMSNSEGLRKLTESMSPVVQLATQLRQFNSFSNLHQPAIVEISRSISDISGSLKTINFAWMEQITPFLERLPALIEHYKILPERTVDALLILAQHGWFLDVEAYFTWPLDMAEMLKSGEFDVAERGMISHFKERAFEIIETVKLSNPERLSLIDKAFTAHCEGNFDLAIPVFLSQADGICREIFGVEYFDGKRSTEIKKEINNIECSITKAWLSPLLEVTSIEWNKKRRDANGNPGFNRNRIMHGDDLSYGTQVNSLKAISFLNYVATVYSPKEISSERSDNDSLV